LFCLFAVVLGRAVRGGELQSGESAVFISHFALPEENRYNATVKS